MPKISDSALFMQVRYVRGEIFWMLPSKFVEHRPRKRLPSPEHSHSKCRSCCGMGPRTHFEISFSSSTRTMIQNLGGAQVPGFVSDLSARTATQAVLINQSDICPEIFFFNIYMTWRNGWFQNGTEKIQDESGTTCNANK